MRSHTLLLLTLATFFACGAPLRRLVRLYRFPALSHRLNSFYFTDTLLLRLLHSRTPMRKVLGYALFFNGGFPSMRRMNRRCCGR